MNYIMFPIPEDKFAAVCALLGGATASSALVETRPTAAAPTPAAEVSASTAEASPTANEASDDSVVDAHGWPWSADLHASTKGLTKEGLWRMKVGATRPEPKPGFPKEGSTPATGTEAVTSSTSATSQVAEEPAATGTSPAPTATQEDDDEFAAFRAAAEKSDAADAKAATSVPARKWTDADLSVLCNQAAVKLGDPSPVKETIMQFVPDGEVPHSRNIPEDKREDFAKAIEAKAGIEFAG